MIGKTLAHYEVTGLLGSGGMGDVWRARDTRLGRDVALKVLPDAVTHDPERRARFEREARAIAAIDHPNVVTIYAVEEAEGHLLLSMEVVEGQTLGELIPPGGLPLDRILEIATPMASALAAAHGRGITHRDLKPANVMVRPDGQVRILDFGLAKLVDGSPEVEDATIAVDATAEGRVLGTTAYMSPEQAEGKPVDPRTDVFALGILLYQMATGEKPFVGDTPISTITSILRDEPRPMHELKPELPTQLGRIIGRCLQKDPENRYDTAKGLMFELENLQEDSSSSSMAAVSPPRSGTHRNRMLGAAAF
ncbi:MAG TPA: serine/threonine-protein kinase, partial [Candidatus Krumholzibacteria bacterium]|nr:serine/threonine-protein kinase [Candidatus Krumholzibacteria bacterium]